MFKFRKSPGEYIQTQFLRICAVMRWVFKKSRNIEPSGEYVEVFSDYFKDSKTTENWRLGQPWGDFHAKYLNQYYDTTGELAYIDKNLLFLGVKRDPKEYIKAELPEWRRASDLPDRFTIPIATGLVSSKNSWTYGWFEAYIKLPEGMDYWPAFWMSGVDSWPPEIDIFEAYSDGGRVYNSGLGLSGFRIQPNIYGGDGVNKWNWGGNNFPVWGLTGRFVQYVLHWEADFIKIYYDGFLVFQTRDKSILKWFRDRRMYMILGHGIIGYKDDIEPSNIVVSQVRVFQKNVLY